ncbi:hypothetical protein ACE6H2_028464 [Prunus campanulata]
MKLKSWTCIKNFSKTIFESNLASQERAVGVGYVAFKQPSKERLQWDNIVRMGFDQANRASNGDHHPTLYAADPDWTLTANPTHAFTPISDVNIRN